MQVRSMKIDEVKPYPRNPRNNDNGVDAVANSIKEFGWQQPIVVDKDNVIIVGHTRYKAAKKLGMDEVPVVVASKLTPEQVKAYRLADNKTGELTDWDDSLLDEELNDILDIDMSDFGFEDEEAEDTGLDDAEEKYTQKVDVPQYQMNGDKPAEDELVDTTKRDELVDEINRSSVSQKVKDFLRLGAQRHLKFDYGKIAEYYAHADKATQQLMEDSALVIIDYDNAMKDGYAKFTDAVEAMADET